MSGIVGIFQLNGAPIDQTLLARLTNSLAFRGPDAQRIWYRGPIGFGHTLLQSAIESKDEHQPLSLDGNLCIVADARVDGRRDLIATLRSHGELCSETAADAELILRAYTLWGDACVDRLIGDFSFAIWNARTRRPAIISGLSPFSTRTSAGRSFSATHWIVSAVILAFPIG
jgi:asparagine synthase (glutamine-hydrolysing)